MGMGGWLRAEGMDDAKLSWSPDRGFVLSVDTNRAPVVLRFKAMPLPADGTVELCSGVELDRIALMFKAEVEVAGEPGMLLGCTVKLVDPDKTSALALSGEIEDTETGDVTPLELTLPVAIPKDAPKAGGPRPDNMDEDELDWQDETTLDEIVLPPPPKRPAGSGQSQEPGAKGYERLLAALAAMDDDDELELDDAPEASESVVAKPPPPPPPPADPDDQSLGADAEARGFLELLVRAESLELEEGASLDALLDGTKRILKARGTFESKAGQLSNWLLDQDSVADLYIGDEELASLLEQW